MDKPLRTAEMEAVVDPRADRRVSVEEGRLVRDEYLGVSNGAPNQRFVLPHARLILRSLGEKALRQVGAIFETPSFYEYLSGWQNLKVLAALSGDRLYPAIVRATALSLLAGYPGEAARGTCGVSRVQAQLAVARRGCGGGIVGIDPHGLDAKVLDSQLYRVHVGLDGRLSCPILKLDEIRYAHRDKDADYYRNDHDLYECKAPLVAFDVRESRLQGITLLLLN